LRRTGQWVKNTAKPEIGNMPSILAPHHRHTSHPDIAALTISGISVVRMRSDRNDLDISPVIPQQDAFSVIVQLQDFVSHKLWKNGQLAFTGGHRAGTLSLTDMRETWQCHHLSPFDNIRFQITAETLRDFARDTGRPEIAGLESKRGLTDPVLSGLAQAVAPFLDIPEHASPLFLEQMMLAMLTHVTQHYGGLFFPSKRGGLLSALQEKRVTEYLANHTDKDLSIATLADQCGLSRSYFNMAFKNTFGITPHRWLVQHRLAKARQMLLGDLTIAEIAVACDFSDQSHLTRVFTSTIGVTPAAWRQIRRD
jgi:AraC-like DNA-binding protein